MKCIRCQKTFDPGPLRKKMELCKTCRGQIAHKSRFRAKVGSTDFFRTGSNEFWLDRKRKNEDDRTDRAEPSLPRIKWLERGEV